MNPREFDLPEHSDARGHLVVATGERDIPFLIRRVFWIHGNTTNMPRAAHGHRRTSQALVCVAGSCRVAWENALGSGSLELTRPDHAVSFPPLTWLELTDFSSDAVLLVLADRAYDPDGVISNHAEFRELIR